MGNCKSDESVSKGQVTEYHSTKSISQTSNPFYLANCPSDSNPLTHYKFHSNYEDKFLGRCTVLEETSTNNLYLCKDFAFGSEAEYEERLSELQTKKQQLNSQNLIRIKEVMSRNVDGFISESKKILLIVDYPLTSLQRQYSNRIINRLLFEREQITGIMYAAIKGYAKIEQGGYKNDKIRLKNMFVGIQDKAEAPKVIDSSLLREASNYDCIRSHGFLTQATKDIYLAPQEFAAYFENKPSYYSPNAGVFSLGASLLDLCLMDTSSSIYHPESKQMDFEQLKNKISIAGKKQGPIIERFLLDMLAEEKKRLSFAQLQEKIPKMLPQNVDSNSMRCSVIKGLESIYLQQDDRSILQKSRTSRYASPSPDKASMLSSRVFASAIKPETRDQQENLVSVHELYNNGNSYIGQKKNHQKHGRGKYFFKDGSYYEGNWRNNRMEGKGQLFTSDGHREYSGEWFNDEMNGWGSQYSQDKVWSLYQGEFRSGKWQGRGKLTFRNNVVFDGEFKGGMIHGKGRKLSEDTVLEKYWDIMTPQSFIKS